MATDLNYSSFFHTLPTNPDMGSLKKQAKALFKDLNEGKADAIAFLDHHLVDISPPYKLANAQYGISKSYGFKSWSRLKTFVETQKLSPRQKANLLLNEIYDNNHILLGELYNNRDSFSDQNIFVAAATADLECLDNFIAHAGDIGGPRKAQAINYCAHAHFHFLDKTFKERQLTAIKMLLAAGADANNCTQLDDNGEPTDHPLSALYGCCREHGNPEVATLLLDAGARTNDQESLYHASELGDIRVLALLFEKGVDKNEQEFCIRRALDHDNPAALELYLKYGTNPSHLPWALFRNQRLQSIKLLIDYGADIHSPSDQEGLLDRVLGLTPIQIAERNGASDIVKLLLNEGAKDTRTPIDTLIGLCSMENDAAVFRLVNQSPNIIKDLTDKDQSNLPTLARSGKHKAVDTMLKIGFNIEATGDDLNATALNYAACNGDCDMIKLLLAYKPNLHAKNSYGGDPLDTSIYCARYFPRPDANYPETAELLLEAGAKIEDGYLRFALEHNLDDVAEVLMRYGASI
ncbi:MAG: ankyrin repeat domain-containing protein [Pseudomonadales bacterium]|nr:ankyrin repeat domain-containing protein [Pseudomonadales bacterium]